MREKMRVTIIYDNDVMEQGLEGDWGFSCLIEIQNVPQILFDTGASGSILLHNMRRLGLDPSAIGIIVISHAHWDHIGGLSDILEANKEAEIYVPASVRAEIPGRKMTTVRGSIQICENVLTTGELGGIEQSLALDTGKGMLVVVGCSHPGVGEIIDAASRLGKVYGIVGGFHGFRDFKRLNGLSLICPCHCTAYKLEIRGLFPEQCVECGAGLVLEL
jgi:7,8-dihydropterin-6-yl-methyl-4-(beta-D-ribofuranosyl)aminobenzene 5'-phosphate synthase